MSIRLLLLFVAFTLSATAQTRPGYSPIDRTNEAASQQDQKLAPHATPPTATPAEKLPLDKIKLPAGFKAEVWSCGHPGARTMVMGPKGTIFMGTRQLGRVYAITNRDGKREAKVLLQGLTQPNGLAFKDGALYVFAINKVFRYDNIENKLDKPGAGGRADRQVQPAGHESTTTGSTWTFGPDGKLYMQVGANCNICEVNPASTARSAATTRTARAWRSWRAACATRSASTGIR